MSHFGGDDEPSPVRLVADLVGSVSGRVEGMWGLYIADGADHVVVAAAVSASSLCTGLARGYLAAFDLGLEVLDELVLPLLGQLRLGQHLGRLPVRTNRIGESEMRP